METTKNVKLKKILKVVLIISIVVIGIVIAFLFYISTIFSGMGECFMDAGPFYGDKIEIDLDTISIDKTINIPNGKLAFAHSQDSISPVFIKLSDDNKVAWSYRLHTDGDDALTLFEMGNIRLSENHIIDFLIIHFLNQVAYT